MSGLHDFHAEPPRLRRLARCLLEAGDPDMPRRSWLGIRGPFPQGPQQVTYFDRPLRDTRFWPVGRPLEELSEVAVWLREGGYLSFMYVLARDREIEILELKTTHRGRALLRFLRMSLARRVLRNMVHRQEAWVERVLIALVSMVVGGLIRHFWL